MGRVDGFWVGGVERSFRTQETGHKKVEERPELERVVLED